MACDLIIHFWNEIRYACFNVILFEIWFNLYNLASAIAPTYLPGNLQNNQYNFYYQFYFIHSLYTPPWLFFWQTLGEFFAFDSTEIKVLRIQYTSSAYWRDRTHIHHPLMHDKGNIDMVTPESWQTSVSINLNWSERYNFTVFWLVADVFNKPNSTPTDAGNGQRHGFHSWDPPI